MYTRYFHVATIDVVSYSSAAAAGSNCIHFQQMSDANFLPPKLIASLLFLAAKFPNLLFSSWALLAIIVVVALLGLDA